MAAYLPFLCILRDYDYDYDPLASLWFKYCFEFSPGQLG